MTLREVDNLIEEGNSLKQIAQAYSEIANLKIKRVRNEAERNRRFFAEISFVYGLVKRIATQKKIAIVKPKKRVSLIITSNYRFYGNINSSLIDFFIKETAALDTDKIVLGKAAIDYFKVNKIFPKYREVQLLDDQPKPEELRNLVNLIKDYNQVLVFHSKLKSLLQQEATVTDITISQLKLEEAQVKFNFIFEPELDKILSFFDSQILILLLEATFLESEVARTASRFISMDNAESEANKFIKEYEKMRAFILRSLENNKILENFASISAVGKGER